MTKEGKDLTKKQARLLIFLFTFRKEYGESPSLSLVVNSQGLSSNRSVIDMLKLLVARGYLLPASKISKSTILTTKALEELGLISSVVSNKQHNKVKTRTVQYPATTNLKPQVGWVASRQPSGTWPGSTADDIAKLLRNTASFVSHLGTSWNGRSEGRRADSIILFMGSCFAIPIIFGRGVQAAVVFLLTILIIKEK